MLGHDGVQGVLEEALDVFERKDIAPLTEHTAALLAKASS